MQSQTIVNFTVVSGPDLGKQRRFDQERITIGRDIHNDFMLSDGFVSNWHGELVREGSGYVYYDLRSRHGSLVLIDEVSINLHDSTHVRHVRVVDGSEIQVGSTLIRLEITSPAAAPKSRAKQDRADYSSGGKEKFITAAHRPVQDWTRGIGNKDTRLEILFMLSGRLNSLTRIEEILDLIVEATFEAFPAANFFAISMMDRHEEGLLSPFITRPRSATTFQDEEVILSQSIIQRVVETRESILFVRDHLGAEISDSILEAQITACLCAPLVGQRSLLGVMQVDTRGHGSLFSRQDLDLFSVLASNAAFALERARLSEDIYKMFEGFVQASVTAIESRDPTTAGHSERVATYTIRLAEAINRTQEGPLAGCIFTPSELTELRYAALLHDFGKVGVREAVLTKSARISDTEVALIGQRFANFKNVYWRQMTEKLLAQLTREGRPPSDADMAVLNEAHRIFSEELDQSLRTVRDLRGKRDLEPEEIQRILAIGERSVAGFGGVAVPLLMKKEFDNLKIAFSNLNEEEWENMRSHAAKSEDFLNRIPWSRELRRIPCFAGAHHEKLDGTGYPRGLKDEEIPTQVRILTIADIYDALTASDRPYTPAMAKAQASSILLREAARGQLDKVLVELFVERVAPALEGL